MKIQFNKKELGFIHIEPTNNIYIKSRNKEVSLNLRGASIIKDEENMKLIIIANIIVEINYENKTYIQHLNNDMNRFREFIERTRKNKMNF